MCKFNILYVFLFPSQGLLEYIIVDISWIMVGNYVKKKKVMLDEKMGEVAKGEKKKRRKEKCSIVFIVLKILC